MARRPHGPGSERETWRAEATETRNQVLNREFPMRDLGVMRVALVPRMKSLPLSAVNPDTESVECPECPDANGAKISRFNLALIPQRPGSR